METTRFKGNGDEPNWVSELKRHDETSPQQKWGVIAEFATPEELKHAARRVRDAGYTKWDTLTPFPVHGIDEEMGIKPTILPWFTLTLGLTGTLTGILLQWYTNAYDYPFLISGKPQWSLPANIPVAYELTILFAAWTTFFAVLGLNMLPQWFHPVFRHPRMARYTGDRFALLIEAKDPMFDAERVRALLVDAGGSELETLFAPKKSAPLPRLVIGVAVLVSMLALVPPAFALKARHNKSPKPRIHIIQDMDMQPKFKAQAPSPLFAKLHGDPRASVMPPAGTVARGDRFANPVHDGGRTNAMPAEGEVEKPEEQSWVAAVPADYQVDSAFLDRGQERFAVYCTPCHGLTGAGDGMIAKRAGFLAESQAASGRSTGMSWVKPANLADERIAAQPVGQIYNTITNGLNNMKPYRGQIPAGDRWAIASYVKALQLSQTTSVDSLTQEQRAKLE